MATAPRPRSPRTRKTPRYEPVLELPPLPPEQHEALRGNIALHGVLVPILVDGDGPVRGIIDGNHRKGIADELGYDCPEVVKDGLSDQEKRTLARALNLARRQLDQAAMQAIPTTRGKDNKFLRPEMATLEAMRLNFWEDIPAPPEEEAPKLDVPQALKGMPADILGEDETIEGDDLEDDVEDEEEAEGE